MSICQYSCKKEILDTCSRLVYLSSSRLTIDPRLKINNELKVGQRIMNNERWKMFISQIKSSWAQSWSESSPQTVHPGSTRREERFLTVKDLLLPRRSFRWKKQTKPNSFASSLMEINERLMREDRTLERGWATLFQQNKTISDFRTDISETASTPDITGLQMVV